ncbi:MAG TPA: thiamine pyrophosphate-dependent enzyme [Candidatus Dormibacteraeota bacterium]
MNRNDAIAIIAAEAETAGGFVFAGNGYNARALSALSGRPECFEMVGSMSLCPTLAAGFSRFTDAPVVVVEGDGNALMGLSGYPAAAAAATGTFVHVVLDNGQYETTGGQRTLADRVDLATIARGAGYARTAAVREPDELRAALREALAQPTTTFVHLPTDLTPGAPHPRVPRHPREIAARFRAAATRV